STVAFSVHPAPPSTQNAPASLIPRRADPADDLEANLSSGPGHDGPLGFILDDEPRPVGGVQRQADADRPAVVFQEAARPAIAVRSTSFRYRRGVSNKRATAGT